MHGISVIYLSCGGYIVRRMDMSGMSFFLVCIYLELSKTTKRVSKHNDGIEIDHGFWIFVGRHFTNALIV